MPTSPARQRGGLSWLRWFISWTSPQSATLRVHCGKNWVLKPPGVIARQKDVLAVERIVGRLFLLALGLLLSPTLSEALGTHHHSATSQPCHVCASLPGARKKDVPLATAVSEMTFSPGIELKLTIVRDAQPVEAQDNDYVSPAVAVLATPTTIDAPRAPPPLRWERVSESLSTHLQLDTASPRAPPTA